MFSVDLEPDAEESEDENRDEVELFERLDLFDLPLLELLSDSELVGEVAGCYTDGLEKEVGAANGSG